MHSCYQLCGHHPSDLKLSKSKAKTEEKKESKPAKKKAPANKKATSAKKKK